MKYDGKEELMKAILGLKFRCVFCGRLHNPEKNAWKKCKPKIEKIIEFTPKDLKIVKDAAQILGEKEVKKIIRRYSFRVQIYDNDYECVTVYYERIKDRILRAYILIGSAIYAFSRELRKRCKIAIYMC
jgi:hypothetical protein